MEERKKGKALNLIIPETLYNDLKQIAERQNNSLAATVRAVLSTYVNQVLRRN